MKKKSEEVSAAKRLKDFRQQKHNANKHTQRGMDMLEDSMNKVGYTAPMIATANGEVISGSARHEVAAEVFGPEVEPIVVKSDGKRPIVVVRTDIPDAEDVRAKEIAVLENRVAEVNLDWNIETIAELNGEIPDVLHMSFNSRELEKMLNEATAANVEDVDAKPIYSQWIVAITCSDEKQQLELLERLAAEGLDVKAMCS